jgi:hypothetical protein
VWAGREVEVVFDPRRHQIVMVRNEPGDSTRSQLATEGFRRLAVDGTQEMWARDRLRAVQQLLGRSDAVRVATAGASVEGRAL